MHFTPFEIHLNLRESLVQYLETAYKISDPRVFAERDRLLREPGAGAQEPVIETTPDFPKTRSLRNLTQDVTEIPAQLADLASFGTPAARSDTRLYSHQDRALVDWFKSARNLIVASGTGSGKTEIFLFIALAE